jgi:hypothetical protein
MNVYDFAIQMSSDGEKFFQTLTKQVKKPGLRTILVMLANDQAIHRRGFEKRRQKEGASLSDAKSLTGVLNPFAQRLKRLGRGERLDEDLPPAELYRRGQELDKECEDFFRKRASRVKNQRSWESPKNRGNIPSHSSISSTSSWNPSRNWRTQSGTLRNRRHDFFRTANIRRREVVRNKRGRR